MDVIIHTQSRMRAALRKLPIEHTHTIKQPLRSVSLRQAWTADSICFFVWSDITTIACPEFCGYLHRIHKRDFAFTIVHTPSLSILIMSVVPGYTV